MSSERVEDQIEEPNEDVVRGVGSQSSITSHSQSMRYGVPHSGGTGLASVCVLVDHQGVRIDHQGGSWCGVVGGDPHC